MKLMYLDEARVEVVLSERNLRALLAKLSQPESKCTLAIFDDLTGVNLVVRAQNDIEHYVYREPGELHAETEAIMDAQKSVHGEDDGA